MDKTRNWPENMDKTWIVKDAQYFNIILSETIFSKFCAPAILDCLRDLPFYGKNVCAKTWRMAFLTWTKPWILWLKIIGNPDIWFGICHVVCNGIYHMTMWYAFWPCVLIFFTMWLTFSQPPKTYLSSLCVQVFQEVMSCTSDVTMFC